MKQAIFLFTLSITIGLTSEAQVFKNILKKDSSGKNGIQKIIQQTSTKQGLSNDDVISGLKEALTVGANNGANKLSAVDGFFKDAAIKILMPEEAQKVEKKLRGIGLGKQVDDA